MLLNVIKLNRAYKCSCKTLIGQWHVRIKKKSTLIDELSDYTYSITKMLSRGAFV